MTTSACASCHLEPLSNLRTFGFFFCTRSRYFPSQRSCQRTCDRRARCLPSLPRVHGDARVRALTHVYCHHQEVAPLNSSAELNAVLPARISSCGGRKTQTEISAPKNRVTFRPLGGHNISALAQKHWPNRTQVRFSTKALFDRNISVVLSLYSTRLTPE